VTRAQQRLYLCHAWSRSLFGQTSYNPPSRFLGEIPEALLDVREAEKRSRGRRRGWQDRGPRVAGPRPPGEEVEAEEVPARVAAVTRSQAPEIGEGDTVQHDRWGEGVVLSVSGYGEDAEATISFAEMGEKRVLLAYAPLRKVG
jgi:DNA helicase-2/ATP-dependent DNA helicase PcrA